MGNGQRCVLWGRSDVEFVHHNLIRSSLSPSGRLGQILRHSLKTLINCIHENEMDKPENMIVPATAINAAEAQKFIAWPASQLVYHPLNGHVTCAATWYADYWTQYGFSHSAHEPFNVSCYHCTSGIQWKLHFLLQLQYMKSKPCPHIILSLRWDVFVSRRAFHLFPFNSIMCESQIWYSGCRGSAEKNAVGTTNTSHAHQWDVPSVWASLFLCLRLTTTEQVPYRAF